MLKYQIFKLVKTIPFSYILNLFSRSIFYILYLFKLRVILPENIYCLLVTAQVIIIRINKSFLTISFKDGKLRTAIIWSSLEIQIYFSPQSFKYYFW